MKDEQTTLDCECPSTTQRRVDPPEQPGLITEEQLRVALNLPNVWAVRDMKKKRKIPYIKIGHRTVRYSLSAVLVALSKREVKEAGATR